MPVLLPYNSSNSYPQIAFSSINEENYADSNGVILGQIKQEAFYVSFTMPSTSGIRTYVVYNLADYPNCNGIIVNGSLESNYVGPVNPPNNVTLNFNQYFVRTIVTGSGTSTTLHAHTLNIDNASTSLTSPTIQENTQTFPIPSLNPLNSSTSAIAYANQIVQFRLNFRANFTYYIKGITTFI